MTYDRKLFFDAVRDDPFDGSLTQEQVDGMGVILAVWEFGDPPGDDERHLAYMLATAKWETASHMWPITEMGSQDYLQGKAYYPYIGRGFVQLTWDYNYERASKELGLIDNRDLYAHPDMALDSLVACRCLFKGMAQGWFTGVSLSDYFNETDDDPKNARRIINGNDKDDEIAAIHRSFLKALEGAGVTAFVTPNA